MLDGLAAPDFRNRLIVRDGGNRDIITVIHKNLPEAVKQVAPIAETFRGDSILESGANVWRFLKEQIAYNRDPDERQLIRLPSRFVADGEGDCKSFSLFAASVMSALGYRVAFKYVSYNINPVPSHVYVVASDGTRNVIIDGVYDRYNAEKKPVFQFVEKMDVYTLSGISGRKKKKGKLKKIALAPARRAFRSLVALNFRGLATKLAAAIQANQGAVSSKWKKLGGNFSALVKSVNVGKKKRKIFGLDQSVAGIGDATVAVTFLAAAAPVLIAMSSLLKNLKGDDGGELSDAVDQSIDAVKKLGGNADTYAVDPSESPSNFDTDAGKDDEPGFRLSKPLLIGGGVLLVLYLMGKGRGK